MIGSHALKHVNRRLLKNLQDCAGVGVRRPNHQVHQIRVPSQVDQEVDEIRGRARILDRLKKRFLRHVRKGLTRGFTHGRIGVVRQKIETYFEQNPLPEGYFYRFGGSIEDMGEMATTMLWVMVLIILLVYMVMASLYESLLHPFLILLSIPLALGGVIVTLFVTGTTLNIESLMGSIVLVGIVVNNAIVLLDYINILRRRDGMDLTEAVILAGKRRLRPILMTAFTTGMALLPVALAIGRGTETQAPMARAVVGGLLIGTLVTLLFLPTIYHAVEALRSRLARQP